MNAHTSIIPRKISNRRMQRNSCPLTTHARTAPRAIACVGVLARDTNARGQFAPIVALNKNLLIDGVGMTTHSSVLLGDAKPRGGHEKKNTQRLHTYRCNGFHPV
jgi:hypothetical protein